MEKIRTCKINCKEKRDTGEKDQSDEVETVFQP